MPRVLLEGDQPTAPPASGPGQRYALGPLPPALVPRLAEESAELPEAYGTQRLLLTARDPHWLYAHWDFTRDQLRHYNSQSADGHLVLRAYVNTLCGAPHTEVPVHPESRHWFVHVGLAGVRYLAELGFYDRRRQWQRVATSAATLTPPDTLAEEATVTFATIPAEVPFPKLVQLVQTAVSEHVPLTEALEQLRATGHPDLPEAEAFAAALFTPAQERALAEVVTVDQEHRVWIGSLEVTELVRRQWAQAVRERGLAGQAISSVEAAKFALPASPAEAFGAVASPGAGQPPRRRGFWFNVNAELIIYGATERDAQVSIGGRAVQLRPDGSFSFRFALPDGRYELPVVALSADKAEARSAELKFSRVSSYSGDVGAHAQDAALKTPDLAHVS